MVKVTQKEIILKPKEVKHRAVFSSGLLQFTSALEELHKHTRTHNYRPFMTTPLYWLSILLVSLHFLAERWPEDWSFNGGRRALQIMDVS